MNIESTHSTGYAFQIEMTYRALHAGGRIEEVPIAFTDRVRGHLEDVEPHRRRGDDARDAVGAPRPGVPAQRAAALARAESAPDGRFRASCRGRQTAPNRPTAPPTPAASKRFWIGLSAITARRARVARRLRDPRAAAASCSTATPPTTTGRPTSSPRASASSTRPATSCSGCITPSAGHPPAYILYLAAVSRFIGTSQLTHRLASTLLGAGAVFMLGVLARRIFGNDWAGWIAALLAAGYAHLWINDEMLMSESMYVLTTALAVLDRVPVLGHAPHAHRGAHGARHRARGAEPRRGRQPRSRSSRSRSRSS